MAFGKTFASISIERETSREHLQSALRNMLAPVLENPTEEGDSSEHLALLVRWFHSSWRDGLWFPAKERTGINYRRMADSILKQSQARQDVSV